jgi:pyruvate kinase
MSGTIRRAKIVCTIGPASNSEEMIRELMLAGMDVARLNFAHGEHSAHAEVIRRLRKVAAELDRSICILQDLQGPKIRTGRLKDRAPIALETGKLVTITSDDLLGTPDRISTTYKELAHDVKPGEHILLSDGRIELVVTEIAGGNVICRVLNGGAIGRRHFVRPNRTGRDARAQRYCRSRQRCSAGRQVGEAAGRRQP